MGPNTQLVYTNFRLRIDGQENSSTVSQLIKKMEEMIYEVQNWLDDVAEIEMLGDQGLQTDTKSPHLRTWSQNRSEGYLI